MLLRRVHRPLLRASSSSAHSIPARVIRQSHPLLRTPPPWREAHSRLFWNRTSDLMSWMGLKKAEAQPSDADTPLTAAPVVAAVEEEEPAPPSAQSDDAQEPPAPKTRRPSPRVTAGGVEVDVGASSIRDTAHTKRALQQFMEAIEGDTAQLLAFWATVRSFRPFVLENGHVREWEAPTSPAAATGAQEASGDDAPRPKRSHVLQLLPLDAFVAVMQSVQALDIGAPACFTGRVVSSTDGTTAATAPESVVFVSEKMVLRHLVRASAATRKPSAHREGKQLFEQYEASRQGLLDTLRPHAASDHDRDQLDVWTRLSKDSYSAYIELLAHLGEYRAVLAFFATPGHNTQFLGSQKTLRKVLAACRAEAESDLARRMLDDFLTLFPRLVLDKATYQNAMQACLKSTDGSVRTTAQLHNALHVFTRMTREAGYVAHPNFWSALFNACVYLELHDDAVAVFSTYTTQRIAPFQHRFTQALRTACKKQQFDTAVAMVQQWVALETAAAAEDAEKEAKNQATSPPSLLDNQAGRQQSRASRAECECFNKVLWEMLKGTPTLAQVALVLQAMNERHAPAGAQVIRQLVARYLRIDSDADTATQRRQCVQRVLALWDDVPRVVARNVFVLHVVLEHCLAAQWDDECAFLLDFALANQLELPMGSVVKIMEAYEAQGQGEKVVALGETLLATLDDAAQARLSQGFFELFVMSFLREQRFSQVLKLNDELKLTTRFPKSQVLALAVKDAASA